MKWKRMTTNVAEKMMKNGHSLTWPSITTIREGTIWISSNNNNIEWVSSRTIGFLSLRGSVRRCPVLRRQVSAQRLTSLVRRAMRACSMEHSSNLHREFWYQLPRLTRMDTIHCMRPLKRRMLRSRFAKASISLRVACLMKRITFQRPLSCHLKSLTRIEMERKFSR